jgi:hypothetical protein
VNSKVQQLRRQIQQLRLTLLSMVIGPLGLMAAVAFLTPTLINNWRFGEGLTSVRLVEHSSPALSADAPSAAAVRAPTGGPSDDGLPNPASTGETQTASTARSRATSTAAPTPAIEYLLPARPSGWAYLLFLLPGTSVLMISQTYLRFGVVAPKAVRARIRAIEDELRALESQTPEEQEVEAEGHESRARYEGVYDDPTLPRATRIGDRVVSRLEAEIEQQGNRANLNLSIGGFAALVAVGFLFSVLLMNDGTSSAYARASAERELSTLRIIERQIELAAANTVASRDLIKVSDEYARDRLETTRLQNQELSDQRADPLRMWAFWSTHLSRISVSLTASVFAFFFLSTYRRNLSEIRYFHNELTNFQARMLAISECATEGDFLAARYEILKLLASTERNFILKKNETTTDLAVKDLDRIEANSLLDTIKALITARVTQPELSASDAPPKRVKPIQVQG